MPHVSIPASLLDHLVRSSGLRRSEARRIVEEVVSFYGETPEAFVSRRHRELQAEGLRNRAIYAKVAVELEDRRFRATLAQRAPDPAHRPWLIAPDADTQCLRRFA